MPIKIVVGQQAQGNMAPPEPDESGHFPIKLKIRKMLNGNLLISDHADMDVVLDLINAKIVCYPKEEQTEEVYDAQDRFFRELSHKGIVEQDTIQGGNIFGSMEAIFPNDEDKIQAVLFAIKKFLIGEEPYMEVKKELEDREIKRLTDPEDSETTELGDIAHDAKKGTLKNMGTMDVTVGGAYFIEENQQLSREQKLGKFEKGDKEDIKALGDKAGVDWNEISYEELKKGYNVEKEHADTVGDDPLTFIKIAVDHLKEFPDYYTRLKKMERK